MSHAVLGALAGLVQLALDFLLQAARVGLDAVVFRPLPWPGAADALFAWSRTLAFAGLAIALVSGALAQLWPAVADARASRAWSGLFVRAGAGVVLVAGLPDAVRVLLDLNNRAVAALAAGGFTPDAWSPGILAGAPLLILGLVAGLTALVGYLTLLYAVRAVRLYWSTALLPWFVLHWLATGNGRRLADALKELLVLIFSQTAQAMGWWLTVRLLGEVKDIGSLLLAAGGLWFMAQVPSTLRHLAGLTGRV
jgi:hypothetical protein